MIQTLTDKLFTRHNISAATLRLDLIHPQVSGNKSFKLKYPLAEALSQGKTGIVTFGGAFSNHLVATAYSCMEKGLASTGIIRGDDPGMNNQSIAQMRQYGMNLLFVSRDAYRDKEKLITRYLSDHPDHYYIPEGGGSELGIKGAAEIVKGCDAFTHIICAIGTGTTMAGIVNGSLPSQQVVGISALKVSDSSQNALLDFIDGNTVKKNYTVSFDYHFGGYAKKNAELIEFMNRIYLNENIPTDFVYTAKLFYAVYDLAQKNFFSPGSKILVIHSGGLQGNRSLPQGLLLF